MPLKKGSSRADIEANIAELIKAGHEPDQAEAIAYRQAGLTRDRYTFADLQGVYTPTKLSAKMSLTPEGFLLCQDVPIARTGQMVYGEGEVPVEARPDGLIIISRDPDEVFRPETMASFEGKPVTLGHPDEFVGPESWNSLSHGTVSNVRRGTGIEDDFLFADLLITSKQAIDEVQQGLREVSCGYEADYEQMEPGRGVQRKIVGNHVALVERGRCGPRCAIGDEDMPKKINRSKIGDFLRRAFKAKDAAELEALEKEAEAMDEESEEERETREKEEASAKTGDALSKILKKLSTMDEDIQELKKKAAESEDDDEDGDGDGKKVKKQEAEDEDGDLTDAEQAEKLSDAEVALYTGDAAAVIQSRAEILAPGTKIPTTDSKATTKDRALALCKCQRKALDTALKTEAGKAAVEAILGSKTVDIGKLPVGMVHTTFMAAAELVKASNNGAMRASVSTRDFGHAPLSAADLNKQNREFWNKSR